MTHRLNYNLVVNIHPVKKTVMSGMLMAPTDNSFYRQKNIIVSFRIRDTSSEECRSQTSIGRPRCHHSYVNHKSVPYYYPCIWYLGSLWIPVWLWIPCGTIKSPSGAAMMHMEILDLADLNKNPCISDKPIMTSPSRKNLCTLF